MSTLKMFKLTSGEEVLAKVMAINENSYEIENAVSLMFTQDNTGKVTTGFAPFMPHAEGRIKLHHSAIASEATPNKQISNEHLRVFSDIVLSN